MTETAFITKCSLRGRVGRRRELRDGFPEGLAGRACTNVLRNALRVTPLTCRLHHHTQTTLTRERTRLPAARGGPCPSRRGLVTFLPTPHDPQPPQTREAQPSHAPSIRTTGRFPRRPGSPPARGRHAEVTSHPPAGPPTRGAQSSFRLLPSLLFRVAAEKTSPVL